MTPEIKMVIMVAGLLLMAVGAAMGARARSTEGYTVAAMVVHVGVVLVGLLVALGAVVAIWEGVLNV